MEEDKIQYLLEFIDKRITYGKSMICKVKQLINNTKFHKDENLIIDPFKELNKSNLLSLKNFYQKIGLKEIIVKVNENIGRSFSTEFNNFYKNVQLKNYGATIEIISDIILKKDLNETIDSYYFQCNGKIFSPINIDENDKYLGIDYEETFIKSLNNFDGSLREFCKSHYQLIYILYIIIEKKSDEYLTLDYKNYLTNTFHINEMHRLENLDDLLKIKIENLKTLFEDSFKIMKKILQNGHDNNSSQYCIESSYFFYYRYVLPALNIYERKNEITLSTFFSKVNLNKIWINLHCTTFFFKNEIDDVNSEFMTWQMVNELKQLFIVKQEKMIDEIINQVKLGKDILISLVNTKY